jgi:hypothetical protein
MVANASASLANAASGYGSAAGRAGDLAYNSQRLAGAQYDRAGQTAGNVGGMITGLGKLGLDLYRQWNTPGYTGMTYSDNGGIDNTLF